MKSGVLKVTAYEKKWEDILVRNSRNGEATKLLEKNYNPMRTYEWAIWKTRNEMVKQVDENIRFSKENLEDIFLEPMFPVDVLIDVMDKNNWTMKELIQAHNENLYVRFLRIAGLPKEKYLNNRKCA